MKVKKIHIENYRMLKRIDIDSHLDVLLEVPSNKMLFEHIKRWPYEKVQKI